MVWKAALEKRGLDSEPCAGGFGRQDGYSFEGAEFEQMLVARDDVVGVGGLGAFQHAVVRRVLLDEVHGLAGVDEYGHGFKFFSIMSWIRNEWPQFLIGQHADEFGKQSR